MQDRTFFENFTLPV
jgi:hypothetical protein